MLNPQLRARHRLTLAVLACTASLNAFLSLTRHTLPAPPHRMRELGKTRLLPALVDL